LKRLTEAAQVKAFERLFPRARRQSTSKRFSRLVVLYGLIDAIGTRSLTPRLDNRPHLGRRKSELPPNAIFSTGTSCSGWFGSPFPTIAATSFKQAFATDAPGPLIGIHSARYAP
jgi:hypothetical protein